MVIRASMVCLISGLAVFSYCKWTQKIDDELVLPDSGATVFAIYPGRNRLESYIDSASGDKPEWLFVNLVDACCLDANLRMLESADTNLILLLGNATATLPLDDYVDGIAAIDNLAILILDSVDVAPNNIDRLTAARPSLEIVRLENTARECISQSYRHAYFSPFSPFLDRVPVKQLKDFQFLDDALLFSYSTFIGNDTQPVRMKPLPRRALQYFRHFHSLRKVIWRNVELKDDDLGYLKHCELEVLDVSSTPIEGHGLDDVSGTLSTLYAADTKKLELIEFGNFPNLLYLDLTGSSLPSDQFGNLSLCRELKVLRASQTALSVSLLGELVPQLPSLEYVELDKPSDDENGEKLNELRERFPHVNIVASERWR